MAKATETFGKLNYIEKCKITIGDYELKLKILPEITDTKRATYTDTTIIGRSFPIKTYSHSDNRVIGMRLHFLVVDPSAGDVEAIIEDLYAIESAVYPRDGSPYKPPPVCKIECGKILGTDPLCVILESYNASFPTNVVWDEALMVPYYFTLDTTWHVVYASDSEVGLPYQEKILSDGN